MKETKISEMLHNIFILSLKIGISAFISLTSRYFIKLSYKGTNYHGWQVQPNARSVQEIMNNDVSILLGREISVTGCGRTDAGVHARVFYAHFDMAGDRVAANDVTGDDFIFRLNGKLPRDIAVHEILPVKPDAHARFDAVSRTYEYHILRCKEVFLQEYAHYLYGEVDTAAMQAGADMLREYTDFTSFSKVDTEVKTGDCRISEAIWEMDNEKMVFRITADRFLRNMVRAIVGTLIDVGFNRISLEEFRRIIESKNRSSAGKSAPAKGLFLTGVRYPDDIFLRQE
jgi:tRNA pseudouridine38-40 synthase